MDIYKSLLEHFCRTQKHAYTDDLERLLRKPFGDRNYIVASDGVGAILIPRDLLADEEYPNQHLFMNNSWSGIVNIKAEKKVFEIEFGLALLKTKSGKKFYENSFVNVFHASFLPKYFESYIVHTANVLNADTISFIHYTTCTNACAFQIKDCIVLIMPLRSTTRLPLMGKIFNVFECINIPQIQYSVYDKEKQ